MKKEPKFDLNDISIVPAIVSNISSRSECDIYYDHTNLPLMAAPMDTVINEFNYEQFILNGIIPCLPRGFEKKYLIHTPHYFQAVGLDVIEKDLISGGLEILNHYPKILIDIANGHMQRLVDIVKRIKAKYPNVELMVGNVAHPLTFKNLAMAGADYIRLSIGTGGACTTASNVAINYPMGSLIYECRQEKIKGGFWNTKIVADGGMKGYDDILKSVCLGADYVMIGSLFNKSLESAGFNYLYGHKISQSIAEFFWNKGFTVKKKYRGMSTKEVQRSWKKINLKTAEGIVKYQNIEYTLNGWTNNFKDYMKSCMSYCNAKKLEDFIGYADWEYITNNSYLRFKK